MKINVKVNEKSWKFYLQNPEVIIKKKSYVIKQKN